MPFSPVVLYVEDDVLSREIMSIIFRRVMDNPNLILFENSANFIGKLEKLPSRPQIILTDIYMAPEDGITMLHKLRTHPDYASIPVAAITASMARLDVEKIREAGFDGMLVKPIIPTHFPGQLARLINRESIWPSLLCESSTAIGK